MSTNINIIYQELEATRDLQDEPSRCKSLPEIVMCIDSSSIDKFYRSNIDQDSDSSLSHDDFNGGFPTN